MEKRQRTCRSSRREMPSRASSADGEAGEVGIDGNRDRDLQTFLVIRGGESVFWSFGFRTVAMDTLTMKDDDNKQGDEFITN